MQLPLAPRLSKWPFLVSSALLIGFALMLLLSHRPPFGTWELLASTLCAMVGAAGGAFPFVLEYRVRVKLTLVEQLGSVESQIGKLAQVAAQIGAATDRWEAVQESAEKTAQIAQTIADRMTVGQKEFSERLQQSDQAERAALRLEVEKARRAEGDWLQVLVVILDHVYALHQAAVRSGQPTLIEQLGQFQHACRDVARRVGLTQFVPVPEEPFDKEHHRSVQRDPEPGADAVVEETVATGYSFQGRLLRPALVRLRNGNGTGPR
jgi:molecular chaperone GrpE (heat shock protein)